MIILQLDLDIIHDSLITEKTRINQKLVKSSVTLFKIMKIYCL